MLVIAVTAVLGVFQNEAAAQIPEGGEQSGNGNTTNDLVITQIGSDSKINIRNKNGNVHLTVEIIGYYIAPHPD